MAQGQIIEFSHGGEFLLGLIYDVVGTKKWVVLAETGNVMRPGRNTVSFTLEGLLDPSDHSGGLRHLNGLRQEINRLSAEVDLELLWDVSLSDPDAECTDTYLADALFGESSDAHRLSILKALREDSLYFKKKKHIWEPRTSKQVEERLQQKAALHQRGRDRELILSKLVAAWNRPVLPPGTQDPLLANDAVRHALRLVEGFGVEGENFAKIKDATKWLDALEEALGERIGGRGATRAFRAMQCLALWSEHENLQLKRFGLGGDFSADIQAAAQETAHKPLTTEDSLRDLRSWWTCTIDDADTRDIDDALSLESKAEGGWTLAIHIANPTYFVKIGSPLDNEARQRATTVYLPDQKFPMFPSILSEDTLSLVEGKDRPAISTVIQLDAKYNIVEIEFVRSLIRVDDRLDYDHVESLLSGAATQAAQQRLVDLRDVADAVSAQRDKPTHQIDMPETKVAVDLDLPTPQVSITLLARSTARQMVGDFMILNNTLIAGFMEQHQIPSMFRTQPAPEPTAIARVESTPPGLARSFALLKSMGRSVVSSKPAKHYGLGVDHYVQASSPIRRFVDLAIQRQLLAHLAGEPYPYDRDQIEDLVVRAEKTCHEATICERSTKRYWTLFRLADVSDPIQAVVVSSEPSLRATVILTQFAIRAKCKMRSSEKPGTAIAVTIDRIDARRDEIVVRQVEDAEPTTDRDTEPA